MTSNKGVNITSYLLGNQNRTNTILPTGNFNKAVTNVKNEISLSMTSNITRIVTYILAIIIVIMVILLFIHFFIKPIFKLRPGAPGIIPVPGFDNGKLYWTKTNPGEIKNKDLPINGQVADYSLTLDIFVENPLQFSKIPRIIFSRGATRREHIEGDTLLGVFNNYNLAIALLPDTNDLIVSTLNKDNNMENVIISNVPVQEPFKLGVVLMDNALEVYMNGHLMKTKTFASPVKHVQGDIYPAFGIEANMAKLRNLKIWPRILSTSEMRDATPALSSPKDFEAGPIPGSATCSMNTRADALSVNTVAPAPTFGTN